MACIDKSADNIYIKYKRDKKGEQRMIRLSTSDLRKDTADALNKVAYGGDRIALQRRGKDVAVIVSVEDYELLKAIEDKADLETIRRIKEEPGEDVLWEDLKKELGL
jgi:prevent-host-death family protein